MLVDKKKLFIKTYGCQMNVYDSQKIVDLMEERCGFERVDSAEQADMIVVNSCSVRDKASEKLFSELGRWRNYKMTKPDLLIAVGGCVASQEGQNILQRAPYIDVVFGPQTLHRLPDLYNQRKINKRAVIDISFPEIEKFDSLPEPKADGPTAFVSIMEGCSKYCSFCIVPYTRGEEVSRPFDDVILEISQLAEQGVKEVTLLGQNVNDYRGLMHDQEIADLALLIHYVAAIDGIERIRFTTSHPSAFSDRLIQAYAEEPKLVSHLHLPVQSGSDRILSAMKRGYTALEYKSKIRKLRTVRPDISISSDFIVGFPGETEEDFQATMALIKDVNFDNSYSFIYSKRPGTPAANLEEQVDEQTKAKRLEILQRQIKLQTDNISNSMLDSIQKVLVTGYDRKYQQRLSGRTENNRVVIFAGPGDLIGNVAEVRIVDINPNSLTGQLL